MSTLTPLSPGLYPAAFQQLPIAAAPLTATVANSPMRGLPFPFQQKTDAYALARSPRSGAPESPSKLALAALPTTHAAPPSLLNRLHRVQDGIDSALRGLPEIESDAIDIPGYQQQLNAFWNEHEPTSGKQPAQGEPLTRHAWVAKRLKKQWQIAAQLQVSTPKGRALIDQLFSPSPSSRPGVFQVHGPATTPGRQAEFPGVFVITRSPDEAAFSSKAPVLLAIPGKGWIECTSGKDCKEWLQNIMNTPTQRDLLLQQVAVEDREFMLNLENEIDPQTQGLWFDASPISEPLFANRLQSVLAQQQQDIEFQAGQNRLQGIPVASGLSELADVRKQLPAPDVLATYQNPAADAFTAVTKELANNLPNLRTEARAYMRDQVKALTGQEVDPDQIWLHTFDTAVGSHTAFSGYIHTGRPVRSQTLTELALANFSAEDHRAAPGALDQNNGFYRVGPGHVGAYNTGNEFPLQPSTLMKRNWSKGFYKGYKARLDAFWKGYRSDYRTVLKGQFIADARSQLKTGAPDWTLDDYNLAMSATSQSPSQAYTPGWNKDLPNTPLTLADLQAQGSLKGTAHRFDIYGYSGDILLFRDPEAKTGNARQVLYIPGAKPAFVGFKNVDGLREWVVTQAQDPNKRAALAAHFSLYDRQDGATLFGTSGVDSALKGLANNPRSWSPDKYIDMKDRAISGDVFTQMVGFIEQRLATDANTLIKSNGELNKDLWIADIEAGEEVLMPLSPLGGPIALVSALGGATLVGLGTDKAVNSDTQAERKRGALSALQGTLDILFSAGAAPDTPIQDPYESGSLPTGTLADDWPTPVASTPLKGRSPYEVPAARIAGLIPNARGIYRGAGEAFFVRTHDGSIFQIKSDFRLSDRQAQIVNPKNRKEIEGFLEGDELGVWHRVKVKGGGNQPGKMTEGTYTPLDESGASARRGAPNTLGTDFAQYESPEAFRRQIELSSHQKRGLDSRYFTIGESRLAKDDFFNRQRKLLADATSYFKTSPAYERPTLPTLAADARPKEIIQSIYAQTNGMVLGESHSALGSKRFLIDNMKALKKEGVSTLYMEHLQSDLHQADLNSYFDTGKMPERLQTFMSSQDAGHRTDPSGKYTFLNVLKTARENRIRVVALDSSTSYNMAAVDGGTNRQQMMNYYAGKVINSDQQQPHKWVALVGSSHSNTYEGVPGLAEMQGGIGVRVDDGIKGAADTIGTDPGEWAKNDFTGATKVMVKGDLLLTMGTR